jgi:di/tricarboxylate transporter
LHGPAHHPSTALATAADLPPVTLDALVVFGIVLIEVIVDPDSSLVGATVGTAIDHVEFDADILQIVRDGEEYAEPLSGMRIRAGDVLRLRADRDTLGTLVNRDTLTLTGSPTLIDADLESDTEEAQTLVEVVIPRGSFLAGKSLVSSTFRQRYDANVLAFRSRGETVCDHMDRRRIRVGDTLLVRAAPDSIDRLSDNEDSIVAHEPDEPHYRTEKIPHAIAIMLGVVGFAAAPWAPVGSALAGVTGVAGFEALATLSLPILVTALAGVVTMVVTGVLAPTELYDAVEAATRIGVDPFSFVLAVTFAASTAFLTPVGYQTNLFVYGPGGYRFSDYIRVGAPLQLFLSVVTVAGIVVMWGL